MAASSIAPGADPSMEDILASIRRILDEEPAAAAPPPPPAPAAVAAIAQGPREDWDRDNAPPAGELLLDTSMMLPDPPAAMPAHAEGRFPPGSDTALAEPGPSGPAILVSSIPEYTPMATADDPPPPAADPLLAPASADIAASSMMSLVRAVATERGSAIFRGGPTIEDVVREEIRPLVKDWLDSHLPPLVERLVRAEIERVVSRVAP